MISNKSYKNILKYILFLSSIEYIQYVNAINQCTSNLDCAKYNTEVDTHVCIRWDGQKDFVCYLEAEAYCDTDATCQGINEALKYCYVPPWITNKNSQKQCFTVHTEGGTCVEDIHCSKGLVCTNNLCSAGGVGTAGKTNANTNANGSKVGTANTNGNVKTNNNNNNKTGNTKVSNDSNKNSNSTSSLDLEYEDEEKKEKPIEIIGLPLWAFIGIVTLPVIFLIVILWGLSIGRRSYREEEERKKNKMVLNNNKKDLDANKKTTTTTTSSSDKLLADNSSDYKGDMLKSYLNGNSGAVTSISSSSNSTIANNLSALTPALKNKSSQASLEPQKLRKNKKSTGNLSVAATATGGTPKAKKPKSIVNSEFSDTNSQKGLLSMNGGMGLSAADSGVYSSYFGGGASSTVSSNYFGGAVPTDPMNAYYYQQMIAAQQLQAQQLQAQTLMNQYYMNDPNAMAGMPTIDMMQYQQLYGAGMMNAGIMNNQMLYQAAQAQAGATEAAAAAPKKSKNKK